MKPYKTGLVVGKFSPLHLGHELLISRAMEACDATVIISYSLPELPGCEAWRREKWLSKRFPEAQVLVLDGDRYALPDNDADAGLHREFVGHLCVEILGKTVDAVFTSEDYGDGFAAALERYFTARLGTAARVAHVNVDQARKMVPVSGTMVRRDPHAHRMLMAPDVYASFVKTVCFLGGESSGKSTMAESMAGRMETLWAAEYGRELWVEKAGELTFGDMVEIAKIQQQREDLLRGQARRYLFCDTSALTTLFYSREMFGAADAALQRMALRPYDYIFLCAPDFEFVQDGTRREAAFRQRQHAWYLDELARREVSYVILEGALEQRIKTVTNLLGSRR